MKLGFSANEFWLGSCDIPWFLATQNVGKLESFAEVFTNMKDSAQNLIHKELLEEQ